MFNCHDESLPVISFHVLLLRQIPLVFFLFCFFFVLFLASCPTGWTENPHSGTCIKLYDEKKSWKEARGKCKEDGADLVKIVDDSMNQFIWGKSEMSFYKSC